MGLFSVPIRWINIVPCLPQGRFARSLSGDRKLWLRRGPYRKVRSQASIPRRWLQSGFNSVLQRYPDVNMVIAALSNLTWIPTFCQAGLLVMD